MIVGIDFASVDGNKLPDFAMAKTMCASFGSRLAIAIFRGAWGTSPDPTCRREWQRAIDAGLIVGSYLYLRAPYGAFNSSPEDQADVLYDSTPKLGPGHLPPILDVEARWQSPAIELEWVHRAWVRLKELFGAPPMIYTSARVWHEDLHDLPAGEMVDSPLWLAKPWPKEIRTRPDLEGSIFATGKLDPVVPLPWGAGCWWMHQYQGDAIGLSGFPNTVDLSRFRSMKLGEQGPRVEWASGRLGKKTMVFDARMRQAVIALQAEAGIAQDGVIGPVTFSHLAWRSP